MLQEKHDGVVEALDLKVEAKRTVLRDLGGRSVMKGQAGSLAVERINLGPVSGYNPPALRFAKRTPLAFPAGGASH
jgi:hypothetical protein